MSEFIANVSKERKETFEIIKRLHEGHPLQVSKVENDWIEILNQDGIEAYYAKEGERSVLMLRIAIDRFQEIDKHYVPAYTRGREMSDLR